MEKFIYGRPDSGNVLIQIVDDHDLQVIESQVRHICRLFGKDFLLVALKAQDWMKDLAPGEGSERTLKEVLEVCEDYKEKNLIIGGYSLAGLFALWAAYNTDVFKAVAAASPSVWFPGFDEYAHNNKLKTEIVYLSLGDKEEKTRNQQMATVGTKIRTLYETYRADNINCVLEWNNGGHFSEPDLRTAKAFAWALNQTLIT
jgi:hypothetical protein